MPSTGEISLTDDDLGRAETRGGAVRALRHQVTCLNRAGDTMTGWTSKEASGRPDPAPSALGYKARRPPTATILIVDDVVVHRTPLVALLRGQGHRLLEASNGDEALAIVEAEHPDLVITDVLMPVMDGYEFVRRLRLQPSTSRIPVLLYTAPYGQREARAFAQSDGIPYVLIKPVDREEALKIIARVLAPDPGSAIPPGELVPPSALNREHLRLLTVELSEKTEGLRSANARLRALVNIGLDFSTRRNSHRRLEALCDQVGDLFGASYVTLGLLNRRTGMVQRFVSCGLDGTDWIQAGHPAPGVLATVVSERRTVRGDNPGGDPMNLQLPPGHPDIHTLLAAPIAAPDHVYGWMCLVGNDEQVFSDDDEQLLAALLGQVGRILGLEYEIAERRRAQEAQRHERNRAQRYLDTAEVILLALDTAGHVTLINRKGCDILGWSQSELLGRDWIDTCLPERLRPEFRLKLQNVINGGLETVENPVLTRSGEERTIEWCNTLVRDASGHITGTLSSGTDITKRRTATAAQRTAEERVRFALESSGVGIWDMNHDTGQLEWSEIMEAQFGLPPGAFEGTLEAFTSRVHPDDRVCVTETMADAVTTGADFSLSYRAIWPDGSVRSLSGSGRVLLDQHGKAVRAVGISMDVTERRALEDQVRQSQKMDAIGGLAGGVAHDFNNLLTVILGHCELIASDLAPSDPRLIDVAAIQHAGATAAALTRQLLAFSRKQIIEPTRLDLSVVVGDMRGMLARLIPEDVDIVASLGADLAAISADRAQVEQIILNLAVNARDAMPHGGTLTMTTSALRSTGPCPTTPAALKPGRYVVLKVTDTGEGMTEAVQARIFEPFFTTKAVGSGTGLGLATVHGIVMQGGGCIDVKSEIDRGTSFTIYFPEMAATLADVTESTVTSRPTTGGETVLVVEDASELRELTRRLLVRRGYTVYVAANASEALRQFDQHPSIDLLLTDVVMPITSGPDLSKALVARRPDLSVIYMSGHAGDVVAQHGTLLPGIAFLQKPFSSEALGYKIREVLDG
jgi:PAS domain S-box-containing protein